MDSKKLKKANDLNLKIGALNDLIETIEKRSPNDVGEQLTNIANGRLPSLLDPNNQIEDLKKKASDILENAQKQILQNIKSKRDEIQSDFDKL